jgi:murein DD-endopeptidase MepM/ murein hydrolase activator NlpD
MGARRRRAHPRDRKGETGDVIGTILTIQVIVCLILVLVFLLYKKADGTGYEGFKSEYKELVTDQSRNGEVFEMFGQAADGVTGAFESLERFLGQLLAGFFGEGTQNQPDAIIADEPPDAQSQADDAAGAYDYLGKDGVYFTGSRKGGMGGWYPVRVSDEMAALPAPTGSTLAPVVLGGYMKPPVTGLITSPFGYRYHPITEATDFHTGMDIAADEGRAILAALPGEVVEVGESQIYGKYIILQHATNLKTFYGHCSEIIAREGMAVRQGERIAKVGNTGMTTGPHLHFSIIVEEQFADPYWLLQDNIELLE